MTDVTGAEPGPEAGVAPAEGADAPGGAGAERWDTIVAGAGVAGLTVAHELAARGYRVLVLEASDRLGGVASPIEVDGLALDAGAESFATRGGAVAELARELGLGDDIVSPNPAGAWLQLADRAVPLPKHTLLGIPSSPLARDVIDVLGWGGAVRAYLDRLMPVLRIGKDDALGPLVRRRMGRKALDRLVGPLAGGVYSADPDLLDVATVAPGLNNALTQAGSLSGAVAVVLEERAAAVARGDAAPSNASRPGSAVQGIRGGIHRLTGALAERAREHRAELRTSVRVLAAEPTGTGWTVQTDAGGFDASSLVVALPEAEALRVLDGVDGFAELAADAGGVTVELVTLVLPAGAIEGDPRGTGVLVAGDAPAVRAKAMTHSSAKWPWLREAAGGREVVRLSYGSGRTPPATEGLDDAAAVALALADARAILGRELPEPVAAARVRWQQGQPASVVGAAARQRAIRAAAAAHEQLLVVGAAVAGTGLAQVVPDARAAALGIRRERFVEPGRPWTDDVAPEEGAADPAPDGDDARASAGASAPNDTAGAPGAAADDTATAHDRGEA
ncbi:protoporphyrinogen oxidase [Agrococcus sp. SCSIO52902]|uniref:protoporphyrinogen oxidase n=1 Tax=Agrococcus sp. SCSIO52902 TaxID=2933290 RepID=UPI001FF2D15A|nr:protoporphyrinogen oxidase [Agrococcus sp. SCSIO52902]UOW01653.1 protoporphyrinogen oxidase [Agrococcus sp. SCSIO52902]